MDDFPQKLKKVVRIVSYRPAISRSVCRGAGPYQLPYNKIIVLLCIKNIIHFVYKEMGGGGGGRGVNIVILQLQVVRNSLTA